MSNITCFRAPAPPGSGELSESHVKYIITDPSHPVLRLSQLEFKKLYHGAIEFIGTNEFGSKPSMHCPIEVRIPSYLADHLIVLEKEFIIKDTDALLNQNNDDEDVEVIVNTEVRDTAQWAVCSLEQWFENTINEAQSSEEYFCPHNIKLIKSDEVIGNYFTFGYMSIDGYREESPPLTLPIFPHLVENSEDVEFADEEALESLVVD